MHLLFIWYKFCQPTDINFELSFSYVSSLKYFHLPLLAKSFWKRNIFLANFWLDMTKSYHFESKVSYGVTCPISHLAPQYTYLYSKLWAFLMYRGFLHYAHFNSANFITAIFENIPWICAWFEFWAIYFISAIFWAKKAKNHIRQNIAMK